MEKNSNLLVAHHLLGAPLVTGKKLVLNFFWEKCSKYDTWYDGEVWNVFSKFHHTHEHEQSPRHQQGLIGLIW